MPRGSLALENAALRQQLAVYQRNRKRVHLQTGDRLFWVAPRRFWPGWTRPLVVVNPATVIGWHRRGFKLLWRRKSHSAKIGRPCIPQKHIIFIQRISGDHPEWGEDRIAEELAAKFGITHSTSTIRRYNDGIFGQYGRGVTVDGDDRKRSYRCHFDRWLGEVMGIKGIPIPYGAPNASPHVERFIRTLRQEALDHFIFFCISHIRRVVGEYIRYYNGARPSQAIHGIPEPYPELTKPPRAAGKLVALPVLGGIQHDYRLAA